MIDQEKAFYVYHYDVPEDEIKMRHANAGKAVALHSSQETLRILHIAIKRAMFFPEKAQTLALIEGEIGLIEEALKNDA